MGRPSWSVTSVVCPCICRTVTSQSSHSFLHSVRTHPGVRMTLVYVSIFVLLHCSPVLPEAEAEPQLYGELTSPSMEPLQNVWQGFGEVNQERDVRNQCGLVDQCCGMETQGCCQDSGQKCFTVYERKCRS